MPTEPAPPLTSEQEASLRAVAALYPENAALVHEFIEKAKTEGVVKAAIEEASEIVRVVEDDVKAISAAMPALKSGWKSSETWLIILVPIVGLAYKKLTGEDIPVSLEAVFGGLAGIYMVARTLLKGHSNAVTGAIATAQALPPVK